MWCIHAISCFVLIIMYVTCIGLSCDALKKIRSFVCAVA